MVFYMIEWRRKSTGGRWRFDFESPPRLRKGDAEHTCARLNWSEEQEPEGDEYRVRKAKLFPLKGT